jgi:hypothetical protein
MVAKQFEGKLSHLSDSPRIFELAISMINNNLAYINSYDRNNFELNNCRKKDKNV